MIEQEHMVVIARLNKEGTIPLIDLNAKSENWWLSVSIISTQFFILNSFENIRGLLVSEILKTSFKPVVTQFFEDGERTPAKGHIKGYITYKNVGRSSGSSRC